MTAKAFPVRVASLLLMMFVELVAHAQVNYVNQDGALEPFRNDEARPFHLVAAGANSLPPSGGTVRIAAGAYRELYGSQRELNHPALLARNPNTPGVVVIGQRKSVVAETTLRFLTQNCRLFDIGPRFAEHIRVDALGDYFGAGRTELDFIAVCEVWESAPTGDLYFDTLRQRSGFPHAFYGGDYGGFRQNNSGLGLLSSLPLAEANQHVFGALDCAGEDCLAAKGWIQADITKDGFRVRIYNTHTQASGTLIPVGSSSSARARQLESIRGSIEHFLVNVPGGVAILLGDMNVIGETGEYLVFHQLFASLGGRDAARNAGNGYPFDRLVESTTFRPSENNFARKFCEGCGDERLDYIFYFPSRDGKVVVQPTFVAIEKPEMPDGLAITDGDGFSTTRLSDHYGLRAEFKLLRLNPLRPPLP